MSIIIADWLDVTFAPGEKISWFEKWMHELGGVRRDEGNNQTYAVSKWGIIKLQSNQKFIRLSISGRVLSYCRDVGAMNRFLQLISNQPHKITRLDAALDLPVDAPGIIKKLRYKYPKYAPVYLSQKPVYTTCFLGARSSDGLMTGTFYVGDRRTASVTARVYDKQLEALQKRSEILPPTTRYEVTCKTGECTLRDVHSPAAMFWHYASPALLPRPAGVPEWVSGSPYVWESDNVPAVDIRIRMADAVKYSDDLARLCAWADLLGDGGRDYLLGLINLGLRRGY